MRSRECVIQKRCFGDNTPPCQTKAGSTKMWRNSVSSRCSYPRTLVGTSALAPIHRADKTSNTLLSKWKRSAVNSVNVHEDNKSEEAHLSPEVPRRWRRVTLRRARFAAEPALTRCGVDAVQWRLVPAVLRFRPEVEVVKVLHRNPKPAECKVLFCNTLSWRRQNAMKAATFR